MKGIFSMKKTRQKRLDQPPQVYDATLKEFIQQQIPDLLPILLPGAVYQETLDVERIRPTMRADRVYKILYRGQVHVLDVELQTGDDEWMVERLLAYHAILHYEYKLPVISLIIYLFQAQMVQSPWYEMSGDEKLIAFRFRILPLFLLDAEDFLKEHLICIYPLLPTMKGVSPDLISKAIDELAKVCHDAGVLSEKFLWMRVLLDRTETIDVQEKIEIERRLAMYESLLENSKFIKQIKSQYEEKGKKEGEKKGEKKGELKEGRRIAIEVVKARFPHLVEVATQRVRKMRNVEVLRQLTVQIAAAPDEVTARRILNDDDV